MKVVLDANRLVSALIKDGSTRRLLLATGSELHAPAFLRHEVERHRSLILRKSGLPAADLDRLLGILLARIRWVEDALVERAMPEARRRMGDADPKDVPYLAAALAIGADAIWSEDADFDAQDAVPRTRHPDRLTE